MPSNSELTYQISVQGIRGTVSDLKGLDLAIKTLTNSMKTVQLGTQQFTQRLNELRGAQTLRTQLLSTNTAIQGTQTASANASMALLNLNYVIRDSPYFFNNFALGVLAVGNNLNPLIDSFNRLRKEALEKNLTTVGLLKQALVGGAGISIAFSLLVTVIQSYVFYMSRASDKNRSLADSMKELWSETYKTQKQWDEFVLALDKMSKSDIEESLRGVNKELKEIGVTFWDMLLAGGQANVALDSFSQKLAELLAQQRALQTSLGRKKEGTVGGGIIEQQEALVESYKILVESAKTDEERVGWLKLYNEAQKELDRLWGKTKEKVEKHKADLKEIQAILNEMLKILLKSPTQRLVDTTIANPFSEFNLRENLGMTGRQNIKNPISETIKQINEELKPAFQAMTTISNTLGNAISNAFLSGKNAIDAATQAIAEFIVQLLVVQSIMGVVGTLFGLPFLAGFTNGLIPGGGLPSSPPSGSLNKGGRLALDINGTIEAKQDKFVIDFKRAERNIRVLQT